MQNPRRIPCGIGPADGHTLTFSGDLLHTAMGKPFSAMFKAKFWPMTARPYRPTTGMAAAAMVLRGRVG